MLMLKVIGSSSKGNCYIFETNNSSLMLDCGILKLIEKIDIKDIPKIKGILITHQHT